MADRQPIVLEGLERVFSTEVDFVVLAACASAEQTVAAVRDFKPDVLTFDTQIVSDATGFLGDVRLANPSTRIVVLTASISADELIDLLRNGVRGVILKEMPVHLIVKCIRRVAEGGQWFERTSTARVVEMLIRDGVQQQVKREALTRRESQIVKLAALGMRRQDIAKKLNVTTGTVKVHLHSIYQKLDVPGHVGLMLYAKERDLADM